MCLLYAFSGKQFEIRTVRIPIVCRFLSIFCFFLLIPQVLQVINIFWIVSILEVSQNIRLSHKFVPTFVYTFHILKNNERTFIETE